MRTESLVLSIRICELPSESWNWNVTDERTFVFRHFKLHNLSFRIQHETKAEKNWKYLANPRSVSLKRQFSKMSNNRFHLFRFKIDAISTAKGGKTKPEKKPKSFVRMSKIEKWMITSGFLSCTRVLKQVRTTKKKKEMRVRLPCCICDRCVRASMKRTTETNERRPASSVFQQLL